MTEKDTTILKQYTNPLSRSIQEQYAISPDHYRGDIKLGLRNNDGTGVLVGVSKVGSVQGYLMQDGQRVPAPGKLYYRGIELTDIVEAHRKAGTFGFEEVAYLLLMGYLPSKSELAYFDKIMNQARKLPEGFTEGMIMRHPSHNIMNELARSVLSLYSYDPDPDNTSIDNMLLQSVKLVGYFPSIVANAYAVQRHYFHGDSLHIHFPVPELSTAENFLRMMRPDKSYTDEEAHLLDMMLMVHAEHGGGNNSTFVCRAMSSSGTDTYSAIAGAVGSLKGPLHGGANAKVMEMFRYIKENVDPHDDGSIKDYSEQAAGRPGGRSIRQDLRPGPRGVYHVRSPRRAAEEVRPAHGGAEGLRRRLRPAAEGGGAGPAHGHGTQAQRHAHVCQCGYVLRPGVCHAGHPRGGVHAAVRLRPYCRLVRQPHRGGGHLPQDHAPGLPCRHHP